MQNPLVATLYNPLAERLFSRYAGSSPRLGIAAFARGRLANRLDGAVGGVSRFQPVRSVAAEWPAVVTSIAL